jgi:hypothetical protein
MTRESILALGIVLDLLCLLAGDLSNFQLAPGTSSPAEPGHRVEGKKTNSHGSLEVRVLGAPPPSTPWLLNPQILLIADIVPSNGH